MRTALCAAVMVGTLAVTGAMAVGANNAHAETRCRSVSASWNAPNGALITKRGSGVTISIIDAVGEYRTHVMISKGTNAEVAQTTMANPKTRAGCDHPIVWTDLQQGTPGATTHGAGATYAQLYGKKEWNTVDSTGNAQFVKWHDGGVAGVAAANYVNGMPRIMAVSEEDSTKTVARLLHTDGKPINYENYQRMDIADVNLGGIGTGRTDPSYSGAPELMYSHGQVCTTFLAYLLARAGQGNVSAHTYTHYETYTAADRVKAAVKSECNDNLGFFEGTGYGNFYCGISGDSLCANAGDQVRNCMAYGDCYDSKQGKYDKWKADPNKKGASISADRLAGYGAVHNLVNGTDKVTGSPWAGTIQNDVVWNSGGAVEYSCFD